MNDRKTPSIVPAKLENLRPGDLITIVAKADEKKYGFSGNPMIFKGVKYPYVYVVVSTLSCEGFDFHTHYDLQTQDVLRLDGKNILTDKQKKELKKYREEYCSR